MRPINHRTLTIVFRSATIARTRRHALACRWHLCGLGGLMHNSLNRFNQYSGSRRISSIRRHATSLGDFRSCYQSCTVLPGSIAVNSAEPGAADGTFNKCKPCYNGYYKQRQRELRRTDPAWRDRERTRARLQNKRDQGKYPTEPRRRKVYNIFRKAVEDGKVVPTDACFDCGHDFSENQREGHHEDYSRPLDVVWLCSLCHGARHQA